MNLPTRIWQVVIAALGVALLILGARQPGAFASLDAPAQWLGLLLFILLSIVVKRAGFEVIPDATHSLFGVIDIAALLVFGPVPGACVAAASELIYLVGRAARRYPLGPARTVGYPIYGAAVKAMVALTAAWVYSALGGVFAPTDLTVGQILPLVGLFVTWFVLDNLIWLARAALAGGAGQTIQWLRRAWRQSLGVELLPLPIAPVLAIAYDISALLFLIVAGGIVVASVLVHRLARTSRQLNDRLVELTTFEELGEAIINAQMDIKRLAELSYDYTTRIVGPTDFRFVLLDAERESLRPVLWVVRGERQTPEGMPLAGLRLWLGNAWESERIPNIPAAPPKLQEVVDPDEQSALLVPLMAGREVIGGMVVEHREPNHFSDAHLRLLTSLASQIAVGLENGRLYEREWKRAVQLSAISEVSRQVAAIVNLDELFSRVVRLIQASFGYDFVQILTLHEDSLMFRASTGELHETRRADSYTIPLGQGITGWVAAEGEPVLANNVAEEARYRPDPERQLRATRSELAVPLKIEERVLGVLDVQSNRIGAFDKDDLFVLKTLADQIAIAIQEARLYQEALARQRLEQELVLAAEIQASLLPENVPIIPGYEVAAFWRPALEMAGDFYDFVTLTEGRWGFVIADVSDKGIPAAMFMAATRSMVRASVLGRRPPVEAITRANALILRDTRADMFVTLCYCVLDPATGQLIYVNAGHTPPLIYRSRSDRAEYLHSKGIVLGAIEDIRLEEKVVTLRPGDVLALYTDGVTEAITLEEVDFGEERLADVVRRCHAQHPGEIIGSIIAAVTDYVGDAPQHDDFALIVIKRQP
ncbi:MAG: SpoIIE family protein phosphatase [Anaerolineae bacterium]